MLQTLKNAWRVPELRNKLLFTLLIILIYRLGASIPVPFVDSQLLNYYSQYSGTVLDFMSILSAEEQSFFTQIIDRLAEYAKVHFEAEKDGSLNE